MMSTPITVELTNGKRLTFVGREAWTLRHLIRSGANGVTTIDHPAPRWSHYVYKLRQAGLVISTEYETHAGPFPGHHGRYRLETLVKVIEQKEAA